MSTASFPFPRPQTAFDDAALATALRGCARHEVSALRDLCAAAGPHLLAQLLQMLGDAREAEEALPECGERIWREAVGYLPSVCPPGPWLRGIARRVAMDRLRLRNAPPSIEELQVLQQQAEIEDLREGRGSAESPLAALDPALRRTLRLAYLSGHTPTVLASALGLSPRAVRAQLRSALAAMAAAAVAQGRKSGAEDAVPPGLLAGAYVLGMQGRLVRLRFAARMRREPALRREYLWWERQLAELAGESPPVRPSADPWPRIAARIQDPSRPPARRRSHRWLWLTAVLVAAAVAMVWKRPGG